jgi:hypothetical protein
VELRCGSRERKAQTDTEKASVYDLLARLIRGPSLLPRDHLRFGSHDR